METRLSTPQQNTHFWYTKILSSPFSLSLYPLLSHPLSEVCVLVYVCVVHVCVCMSVCACAPYVVCVHCAVCTEGASGASAVVSSDSSAAYGRAQ